MKPIKSNLKIIVYGKKDDGKIIKLREHRSWREATGCDSPMTEQEAQRFCQSFSRIGISYEAIEVIS